METLINNLEDMEWLRETLLPGLPFKYKAALIVGNEDYPDRIEVYNKKDPLHTDKPLVFYPGGEEGWPEKRDIVQEIEDVVEKMGNQSSAESWSTPTDEMIEKFGEDVFVVASFGNEVAVNGEILSEEESPVPPEEFFLTGFGGSVPSTEGYAYLNFVIRETAKRLGIEEERVEWVAKEEGLEEGIPVSTSGEVEVYASEERE